MKYLVLAFLLMTVPHFVKAQQDCTSIFSSSDQQLILKAVQDVLKAGPKLDAFKGQKKHDKHYSGTLTLPECAEARFFSTGGDQWDLTIDMSFNGASGAQNATKNFMLLMKKLSAILMKQGFQMNKKHSTKTEFVWDKLVSRNGGGNDQKAFIVTIDQVRMSRYIDESGGTLDITIKRDHKQVNVDGY
jgi:hypothetical protein